MKNKFLFSKVVLSTYLWIDLILWWNRSGYPPTCDEPEKVRCWNQYKNRHFWRNIRNCLINLSSSIISFVNLLPWALDYKEIDSLKYTCLALFLDLSLLLECALIACLQATDILPNPTDPFFTDNVARLDTFLADAFEDDSCLDDSLEDDSLALIDSLEVRWQRFGRDPNFGLHTDRQSE